MEYDLLGRGEDDLAKLKDFGMMLIEHARMDPDKSKKIRKRLNKFYKKKKANFFVLSFLIFEFLGQDRQRRNRRRGGAL